jgi:beta-glucosidase
MKARIMFLFLVLAFVMPAQQKPKYLDTKLSFEERADDLVSRMTLEEKVSQMVYTAPAIPRLGIAEYNWWNECLHGVARNGLATVFPQAIGLAATWDRDLIYYVGTVISDEARAKYNDALKNNKHGIYQGLTFWSPNINIFRDPRWGRGMETYGEDPFLTGQIGTQFVKGLQGNDPRYLKVVSTAKHFAVHSGPEPERHVFNAFVSEYDLRETYLPAFKTLVQEAGVYSVMCAYNRFRDYACCGSNELIERILRKEWKFNGYMVSDCWAVSDIYQFHKIVPTKEEASAMSVKAGTDLECGNAFPSLVTAVKKNLITEKEIDVAVKRLFTARMKLGQFDPPELVPYSKIGLSKLDSKENKQTALDAARKSMVLLKNENNTLPLKKNLKNIAVVGPNANDVEILYGNYNGYASNPVTPLQGLKKKLPNTKIVYEKGCELADGIPAFDLIPASVIYKSADKKEHGFTAEYFDNKDFKGEPVLKRTDKQINFNWWTKSPLKNNTTGTFCVRWSGYIIPEKSGKYAIGGYGLDGFKIFFADSLLVKFHGDHEASKAYKYATLEAGKAYKVKIEYDCSQRSSFMQFIWSVPESGIEERALTAARKADVVIMFMGLSPRLEGEEMNVKVKGFNGGDRTSLDLPETQENLMKKIYALGKPTVLVLLNGSAVSINWAAENIPAIVEAWYPGQAAGDAIADLLFGDYNPSGRLPVTFYKSVNQIPAFTDYSMKGRTYRYFTGDVLYPFGFGLSYSDFEYKNVHLEKEKISGNEPVYLYADVTNKGKVKGDEVVQLYVKGKGLQANDAVKSLKGFEKVTLKPNETKTVKFQVTPQMLTVYNEKLGYTVEKRTYELMVGPSSAEKNSKTVKLVVE